MRYETKRARPLIEEAYELSPRDALIVHWMRVLDGIERFPGIGDEFEEKVVRKIAREIWGPADLALLAAALAYRAKPKKARIDAFEDLADALRRLIPVSIGAPSIVTGGAGLALKIPAGRREVALASTTPGSAITPNKPEIGGVQRRSANLYHPLRSKERKGTLLSAPHRCERRRGLRKA